MVWSRVIGQERVKGILISELQSSRVPHAYLFYGNEGVGKDAMALEFARVLHCENNGEEACGVCSACIQNRSLQHPDVKLIVALPVGKGEKSDDAPLAKLAESEIKLIQEQFRLKGENAYHRIEIPKANIIKINSIREIRRETSMSAYGGRKKVFIISHAEEMGEEASNTLLKTLEEPPRNTMLILTTSRRESLLPTIRSRCQNVRFDPLTPEDIRAALVEREGVGSDQALLVARLANGSYLQARELLQDDILQLRQDVVAFIRHALGSNVVTLTDDVERLAGTRDRVLVERFLGLMLIWFRDAMVLRQGVDVINLDQFDDLKRFVDKFPSADLVQVLSDIERAISLVNKNVYLNLILLQLSVQLRTNILASDKARQAVPTYS